MGAPSFPPSFPMEITLPAYIRHRILQHLSMNLLMHFRNTRSGEVMHSLDVLGPRPALAVVLGNRSAHLQDPDFSPITPDIAVEVISPNETTSATHRKLDPYFDAGIQEVWLVYPDTREVELWTGPRRPTLVFTGTTTLISALLPGFETPLETLFS